MSVKLNLTSTKILNKKFTGVVRGYDPLKVDSFLDEIINDYKTIENNLLVEKEEIETLNKIIAEKDNKIKELELEKARYEARLKKLKDVNGVVPENIELLNRIAKLERIIWRETGKNPDTFK